MNRMLYLFIVLNKYFFLGIACKKTWVNLRDCFRRALKKRKDTNPPPHKIRKWKYEDKMSFLVPHFNEREAPSSINISSAKTYTEDNESWDKPEFINSETIIHDDEFEKKFSITETPEETANTTENYQTFMNTTDHLPKAPSDNTSKAVDKKKNLAKNVPDTKTASAILMEYIMNKKDTKETENPIDKFFAVMADTVKSFSKINQHKVKTKIFEVVSATEMEEILTKTQQVDTLTELSEQSMENSQFTFTSIKNEFVEVNSDNSQQ